MAADINNTVIRLQDKASVFNFVGKQVIGEKVTLDFFMDHWTQLYKDFKDQQTLLSRMVGAALVGNSQRRIDAVERFIAQNKKTTANLDIFKQSLEIMKTNRRWMERNFAELSAWFKEQNRQRSSGQPPATKSSLGLAPLTPSTGTVVVSDGSNRNASAPAA